MEKLEVFFIPSPLMGHAGQAVELARLLAKRFNHVTMSVLVMKLPGDPIGTDYTDSLIDDNIIKFIHFPPMDLDMFQDCPNVGFVADAVIERHKPVIRELVASRFNESGSDRARRLGAMVVDMFCTPMIDVAKEFHVPAYVFFTSNAAFLGIMFHFQTLEDDHGVDISEWVHSSTEELMVPSYARRVPPSVVPCLFWHEDQWSKRFIRYTRKYREAKGIIINTFLELEHHALHSYDDKTPPIYTVGPLLKPEKPSSPNDQVLKWLKGQPKSSVLLLCFGSRGWFDAHQVREIAVAVERSGYRFIWSLRRPPSEDQKGFPGEYADYNEVLPHGFLERTAGRGKVLGWVPQTEVLADVATGGFVSHCGWNSVLESLWYGVPIATWPVYGEQQLDAFQLVKDLGLAVEISLDYNQINTSQKLVSAQDIEKGIKELMDGNSVVRAKVKKMQAMSQMAIEEGGSSFASLKDLVNDIVSCNT